MARRAADLAKGKNPPPLHFARYEDFNELFEAVVAVKERRGVHNSAIALRLMAQLAVERLEELDGDEVQAR